MSIRSNITKKTVSDIESVTGGKLTLNDLLLAIRQGEEMSQVAFAELLDISKQHLCDIERKRKNVSAKLAAKYAEKLGYSKEQFIRLSIQDMLDREKLNVIVEIFARTSHVGNSKKRASRG